MRKIKTLFVVVIIALGFPFPMLSDQGYAAAPSFVDVVIPVATIGSAVVELPMLFRGPMPAVEVKVNGQGPFIFAIDTGGRRRGARGFFAR